MQEDQLWCGFVAGFPIKNVETVDVDILEQHVFAAVSICGAGSLALLWPVCYRNTRDTRNTLTRVRMQRATSASRFSSFVLRIISEARVSPLSSRDLFD